MKLEDVSVIAFTSVTNKGAQHYVNTCALACSHLHLHCLLCCFELFMH